MSVLSIALPLLARPFWVLSFPFLFPFNVLLSLSLSNSNDEVSTQMSHFKVSKWRHDIQHNDTKHNDTKYDDTQFNDAKHIGLICDTQHNDDEHVGLICNTQHNDTQYYDIQHKGLICNTQHNNTQHNDIQHIGLVCDTRITTFGINDTQHNSTSDIMLSFIMLNVTFYYCYAVSPSIEQVSLLSNKRSTWSVCVGTLCDHKKSKQSAVLLCL
jgi:hypothetical protein